MRPTMRSRVYLWQKITAANTAHRRCDRYRLALRLLNWWDTYLNPHHWRKS